MRLVGLMDKNENPPTAWQSLHEQLQFALGQVPFLSKSESESKQQQLKTGLLDIGGMGGLWVAL